MARNGFPAVCQFKPPYGHGIAEYCEVAAACEMKEWSNTDPQEIKFPE